MWREQALRASPIAHAFTAGIVQRCGARRICRGRSTRPRVATRLAAGGARSHTVVRRASGGAAFATTLRSLSIFADSTPRHEPQLRSGAVRVQRHHPPTWQRRDLSRAWPAAAIVRHAYPSSCSALRAAARSHNRRPDLRPRWRSGKAVVQSILQRPRGSRTLPLACSRSHDGAVEQCTCHRARSQRKTGGRRVSPDRTAAARALPQPRCSG